MDIYGHTYIYIYDMYAYISSKHRVMVAQKVKHLLG